jgi:hypothetical protein
MLGEIKDSNGLVLVQVPGSAKAQGILSLFGNRAKNKDELSRIQLAKELVLAWKKEKILFNVPAVSLRSDYWYLIQLYFMQRHVHEDRRTYLFDLSKTEEILMDSFKEDDYEKKLDLRNSYILSNLLKAGKANLPLSRFELDNLIRKHGGELLKKLEIDDKRYKIVTIPFDIYLRIADSNNFGMHNINTFFDGFRLRTDGEIRALFGGDARFGGASFIDSIWPDFINHSIVPRLVIVRKDYGY